MNLFPRITIRLLQAGQSMPLAAVGLVTTVPDQDTSLLGVLGIRIVHGTGGVTCAIEDEVLKQERIASHEDSAALPRMAAHRTAQFFEGRAADTDVNPWFVRCFPVSLGSTAFG